MITTAVRCKTIRTRIWPKAQMLWALTPAPGLRCWAGGPGTYDSDTVDWCPSQTSSEPTPQPGCAGTHRSANWLLGYNRGQPETHLLNLITEVHTRLDLVPAPAPSFWSLMMSMSITINSSSCRGLHRLLNGLRQYVFPSTSATGERWLVVSTASFQQSKTHK